MECSPGIICTYMSWREIWCITLRCKYWYCYHFAIFIFDTILPQAVLNRQQFSHLTFILYWKFSTLSYTNTSHNNCSLTEGVNSIHKIQIHRKWGFPTKIFVWKTGMKIFHSQLLVFSIIPESLLEREKWRRRISQS